MFKELASLYNQNFLNQTPDLEDLKDNNEDLYLTYLLSYFCYQISHSGFAALIHQLEAQYLEDLELSLKMIGADQAVVALSEAVEYCLDNHIQYHEFIGNALSDSDFNTALTAFDNMINADDFDKEVDQKTIKDLLSDAKIKR